MVVVLVVTGKDPTLVSAPIVNRCSMAAGAPMQMGQGGSVICLGTQRAACNQSASQVTRSRHALLCPAVTSLRAGLGWADQKCRRRSLDQIFSLSPK